MKDSDNFVYEVGQKYDVTVNGKPYLTEYAKEQLEKLQKENDELVNALEKIKIRNSAEMEEYGMCENNYAIFEIVCEALEKHKKNKEGGE
jgi:hypothetical protein